MWNFVVNRSQDALKYVERQRGVFGCGRRVGVGSWAEPTPKRQGIVFTHTLAPLVSCVVRIRDKKGALIFLTQTTNDAFFWAPEPSPDAARVKGGPRSLNCQQAIEGPLAALSLTPMHSLRHRLVSEVSTVRIEWRARIFEIWKSRKMVGV